MITTYTFRETMHSPHKEDTDLILARIEFKNGKLHSWENLFEKHFPKTLDLVVEADSYFALIAGVVAEVVAESPTEEQFQKYIKFFINDFYFRKED